MILNWNRRRHFSGHIDGLVFDAVSRSRTRLVTTTRLSGQKNLRNRGGKRNRRGNESLIISLSSLSPSATHRANHSGWRLPTLEGFVDHTYEEIRQCVLDVLAGRESGSYDPSQYLNLQVTVAEVFLRRENPGRKPVGESKLSRYDRELFLEVFWDLFRQGIITLGLNDSNPNFPFFRVSANGKKILEGQEPYFFHDLSTYEKVIKENISNVDEITLIYLKESMQAFLSGCLLSSAVMLGVATEHSFLKLLDIIERNPDYVEMFKNAFTQRTILQKFNKFRNILDQIFGILPADVKEDLDTNLSGILSMIRNFRNESGHPSGKIIGREQCYILLHLFIPCCRKIYELIEYFKSKP